MNWRSRFVGALCIVIALEAFANPIVVDARPRPVGTAFPLSGAKKPSLMKLSDESAEVVRKYEEKFQKTYDEIRTIDQQLIAEYKASGEKSNVLFLCIPVIAKSWDGERVKTLTIRKYSCKDGDGLWEIPGRISDLHAVVPMWIDHTDKRLYQSGEVVRFGGRKAIVLHATIAY